MAYLERSNDLTEIRLDRRHTLIALGLAVLTAVALGAILTTRLALFTAESPNATDLVEGRASPLTILAPDRITFPSPLRTSQAQEQAARLVNDVYDPPDANIAREQVRRASRMIEFLDTVRADTYSSHAEKINWIISVPGVQVSSEVISRTLLLNPTSYRQVISETLYVLDLAMREEIRERDLAAARRKLGSRISLLLSADEASLVIGWAQPFIIPNTRLNVTRSEQARTRAREQVGVVYRTIEKGQAVVRAGEVITGETLEALREFGFLTPSDDLQETIAGFLFSLLIVTLGAAYLMRVAPLLVIEPRVLLILALLLITTALGTKIVVPGRTIVPFLFPFAAAAMLGAALLSVSVGSGLAVLVTLLVGYVSHGSVELSIFALVGSLVAVVTLRQRERLTDFILTGLYVAVTNTALILIFRLLAHEQDWQNLLRLALAAFASGALTGLIALSSQFILGKLAGITTALELIELSRPTHPLLQKLLREAPGTYHHSLIISNLAEHAAQRVGADALLCRVGAYYHDVGKTMNPQFFVENQFDGVNPHSTLDPRTSCAILQQHVLDGTNLAKKYGVSKRVRDLIPQHHGTTLALYFYEKAVAQAMATPSEFPTVIAESDFRYPGPKPQTREAAIMMLADGVEATTRADRPTNTQEIRAIIDRIIEQRIHDGQLDQADITLRDIELIKQAFLEVLQGLYHPRVRYPQPRTHSGLPLPSTIESVPTTRSE